MKSEKSCQPFSEAPVEAWALEACRFGLVLVLLWIGGMKFTAYEAEGIQAFVQHSPGFAWLNPLFGVRGVSALLGVAEILVALLLAAGAVLPYAGLAGGLAASAMFLSTLSFMATTPGVFEPSLGFPALSVVPGQFLIKDAVLLGVSLLCAATAYRRLRPAEIPLATQPERNPVMPKTAIVILCDTEGGEALGRVVNALTAARESKAAGDDLKVVFTGAGTKWVPVLEDPAHKLHSAYAEVKDKVAGACGYCAGAFNVADAVKAAGVCMLEEYGTNMSYRDLLKGGYQVLNF
ncbi:MAG: DUF417 family protein [Candidatus Hydrogenedens sp.]|nr:DUF417 family protein [Candidatus Hydrogenedens sp.]